MREGWDHEGGVVMREGWGHEGGVSYEGGIV